MTHEEATKLLSSYVGDELIEPRRQQLEEHTRRCNDCRLWLETYLLFKNSTRVMHPTSEQLARFIVDPAAIEEPLQAEIDQHVESCFECRDHYQSVQEALDHARSGHWPESSSGQWISRMTSIRGVVLALAAGLILALGALFLAPRSWRGQDDYQLSGESITTDMVFEGSRTLLAQDSAITSRAKVRLHAAETVALGEGFVVGPDAQLVVEIPVHAAGVSNARGMGGT